MEVRSRNLLTHFLFPFLLVVHSCTANCFVPNGTDRSTFPGIGPRDYLPCDATAEVSMCCAIGRQGVVDKCLPGGLCKNPDNGYYYRESCTDKTWKSSACVKLFVDGVG